MTYGLAICVDEGLVFASDSRTNAGPDQISIYSKMHLFSRSGERQIVLLSAGNLATTQAVLARLRNDLHHGADTSLDTIADLEEGADYLGTVLRAQEARFGEAVSRAGFNPEATFIIGGQVGATATRIFLVYPQGNFISTSEHTRYLQIGETKYGKPILDRVINRGSTLEEAARCALVSMDSTIRSNVTVGPPVELLSYRHDSLVIDQYLCLGEDDAFMGEFRRQWNDRLLGAFRGLPRITWGPLSAKPRS